MNAAWAWALIGDGLKLVARLLEHDTPAAAAAAKSAVNALSEGHAGTITPAELAEALASLHNALEQNDAEALAALAAKFGK